MRLLVPFHLTISLYDSIIWSQEYLRTRLAKIERFYMHILETEQEISKLSAAELEFAKEYTVVMLRHMNDNVLTFFPGPYQDHFTQRKDGTEAPAKRDMVSRPDLDRYTFVKALEDVDVDAGEEAGKVEMKKASHAGLLLFFP